MLLLLGAALGDAVAADAVAAAASTAAAVVVGAQDGGGGHHWCLSRSVPKLPGLALFSVNSGGTHARPCSGWLAGLLACFHRKT